MDMRIREGPGYHSRPDLLHLPTDPGSKGLPVLFVAGVIYLA
jgi:hypothetical protein